MKKRVLELSKEQQRELEDIRDHHPTAYLREHAAALLKIAGGMSAHAVAQGGLLRRRKPDTVYGWLNAYQQEGSKGLYQRSRRRGGKILSE